MSKVLYWKSQIADADSLIRFYEDHVQISKGDLVYIKLHMGERKNRNHLMPDYVKLFTDPLLEIGAEIVLFDTPVAYPGMRHTKDGYLELIKKKGFNNTIPYAKFHIVDSYISKEGRYITNQIAKDPTEADAVIVLTHLKGHFCTGFGGSIKNVGMGMVSKETKSLIHEGGKPRITGECTGCGACVMACPVNNIELNDTDLKFKNRCTGCSNCIYACEYSVLSPKIALFDELLVDAANCALSECKKKGYINVLKNISKLCDCMSNPGPKLSKDLGILASTDIVAAEQATLDLIIQKNKKDIFQQENRVPPQRHIDTAFNFSLGYKEYTLIQMQ